MKTKITVLAALLIAAMVLVGNASAQITAFNSASSSFTSPASGAYTINYTVANANDIVVIGFYVDTGNSGVSAVTYHGVSATGSIPAGSGRLSVFYFVNPTPGASTFSATIAQASQPSCAYYIWELSGANLAAPVAISTPSPSLSSATTITTLAANSFIIDLLGVNNGGNPSVPAAGSVLKKIGELDMASTSGGGYMAVGTNTEAAAGAYNLGWTPNGGSYVGETALAFAPAAALVANSLFTWTNNLASGDHFIGSSGNWTNYAGANAAPNSGNGETMQWIGAATSNPLWITNSGSGSPNSSPGYNINLTAGQTAPVNIVLNSNIRLGTNLVVASGAGGLTIQGGTSQYVALGSYNQPIYNPIHNWTNNSASPVTFDNVYFNSGAGWDHTLSLNGTGNWVFNDTLQFFNGSPNLWMTMNGSGSVTLGGTNLSGVTYSGNTIGGLTLNSGTLVFSGPTPWYGTGTITINGGSLDSAVVGLVNANANPENWNGNFTFVGTQSLDTGSGAVTMNASRTVTVSANTFTVSGVIGGSGYSLTKAGAGTMVLNNANTYSGGTVVNAGILQMGNSSALPSGAVTVNSPGTLDLNTYSLTIPNLTGSGTIDTVAGGTPTLTASSSANSTFSGVIKNTTGTLALTKTGNSILTLSGTNTYTGNTTISTGTLLVNGSTASGSAVTVASGATLGGTNTVGGTVNWQSGSSALFTVTTVSGANTTPLKVSGSVTLNNNSVTVNVPGVTPLGPGTYTLMTYNNSGSSGQFVTSITSANYTGGGVQAGTVSTITTSGGTVSLSVVANGISAVWINNGSGNWNVGADWSSNPSFPSSAGDGATLGVGSAYTTVALNTPVSLGVLAFTNANSFLVADAGNTMTFDNKGAGATVSVTGGSSNVVAAAVALNDTVAISTASGNSLAITNVISNTSAAKALSVSGAGTLALSGNNTYGPSAGSVGTTLSGGGVLQLGNNNALGAGDLSVSGSSTVRAGVPLIVANNIIAGSGATATVDNNGNNVTLSGVVSGAGALTKNGNGILTMGSANSYAGDTTVNAAVLKLGVANAVPGGNGYGNVNVNASSTLDLNALSPTLNGLNGAGIVDSLAGGAVTLTLGESGAYATFNGSIKNSAGTLALVKDGAGTQTLAGTNTYSGGTTINAGILQIGNGGTTGTASTGNVTNNGTLQFNWTGINSFTNVISGSGAVNVANNGLTLKLEGNNTFTGNINVNGGMLWIDQLGGLGVGPKTINCTGRPNSIYLDGTSGNLNIDSSITFNLSDDQGVLFNVAGSNTISGNINMPNGGGNPFIVVSNGFLTLAGQISTVPGNNARALTLAGPGNGLASGNIVDNGPQTSVTMQGSGTWTLSGTGNSYTGPTAVNGGNLLINGNNYGSGAVTVAAGATLGGTGYIGGNVAWQAGAFATFTVTNDNGNNDTPLTVSGSLTANSNSVTVYVPGGTPLMPGNYTLMTYNGGTGVFAATPTFTGAGVQAATISRVVTGGGVVTLIVQGNNTWVYDGNGNWTTGANWANNPNFPSSAGDVATFGVASSFIHVNLNASESVGGINFTNANSFIITNTGNTLTLDNHGNGVGVTVSAGTSNEVATAAALNDNVTVNAAGGTSLAVSGSMSGSGNLMVSGNGTLTLSGSNTYSGVTTISLGTLVLAGTNALGVGTLTLNGGSLDSAVADLANENNNPQDWDTNFTFVGSHNLNLGAGSVTMNANCTITVATNILTVGGILSGSQTLTKAGPGTLALGGANGSSFFGNVTLSDGTVAIGDDTALGSGTVQFQTPTAAIQSMDSTARTVANNVTMSSGGIYEGIGNLTFSGTLASGNFAKTFTVNNSITTFSGTLIDGGSVVQPFNSKAGPGTLVLSGDNSAINKGLIISGGTVALGSATALGTSGANMLTLSGGNLDSVVADLVMAGNNPQTWNTNFVFAGSQNLDLGAGSVTMNANCAITVSANTLTVGGAISGANFSLTKAGAGKLVLSGANIYSNTIVSGGTLEIAQATLATNSAVLVATNSALQLDFSTTNQVAALVLNGVSQPGGVYNSNTTPAYITGPGSLIIPSTGPGTFTNTPGINGFTLNGANVAMTVTNGQAGDAYYLLSSTNLSLPINQWHTVATNVPGVGGTFTFTGTNVVTPGDAQQFYILSNTNYNH